MSFLQPFRRIRMDKLVFIKWGGSLITDKNTPFSANYEVIDNLAHQLASLLDEYPSTHFILGHGSGSFGHTIARQFNTRAGVATIEEWRGFWEVYKAAHALNQIVLDALDRHHIAYMNFPPSITFSSVNQVPQDFSMKPLVQALHAQFLPVFFGDVVFDEVLGGSILSTEDVFLYLADLLKPDKILLAGVTNGVFSDFPQNNIRIPRITPANIGDYQSGIQGSASTDVTGGMLAKVKTMLKLVDSGLSLKVKIFSGMEEGIFKKMLEDGDSGTSIEKE